jgi:hypothetical protein
MKAAAPALLLLLAAQAGAQSFVSMGRLFTTPGERAQLDAQRNGALQGAAAPAAAPPAPPAGAASPAGAPGAAPDCPGAAPGCAPAGTAAAQESGAAEAPGLRLDGVIRRQHGPATLIVNGEVQPAPPGGSMRGAVTLQADGRAVVLKPGQRYDPATGEVHEAAR